MFIVGIVCGSLSKRLGAKALLGVGGVISIATFVLLTVAHAEKSEMERVAR